jgi:hypothetical protein
VLALMAACRLFGAGLLTALPKLWESLALPLASASSAETLVLGTAVPAAAAQEVVDALQTFAVLMLSAHDELHDALLPLLPHVFRCLCAAHLAIRMAAASTVAACCARCPTRTMEAIVDGLLPLLSHASSPLARVGAAHAIQAVLARLGDGILPYVVFLVVPILGRMGDSCRSVRQSVTQSFATLVKLMPLESAIPDPVGMRADLLREKGSAREFLAQVRNPARPRRVCVPAWAASPHPLSSVPAPSVARCASCGNDGRVVSPDSIRASEPALVCERPPDAGRVPWQLMDSKKIAQYEIPIAINAELRQYQKDGLSWLAFLRTFKLHGILADDMGLGKTLQSICILAGDFVNRRAQFEQTGRAEFEPLPSLVVCPPTVVGHWHHEVKKFCASSSLEALAYVGTPTERRALLATLQAKHVLVCSYEVIRKDVELFAPIQFNYCILDEGHIIKNSKSKITLAVKRIRANHRLILSGTPIQNNVLELWSLFDFLMPGYLGDERHFSETYAKPIQGSRDPKATSRDASAATLALEALHRQVNPPPPQPQPAPPARPAGPSKP